MPTNRPFFANFLAAFRAHSAISKPATTTTATTTTSASTTSPATSPSASAFSPPSLTSRSLTTKATTTTPTTTSPTPTTTTTTSHLRHPSSSTARSPPTTSNFSRPPHRRGSDSSSEFRDLGEKWYVGGRTASGEERFYKLGMVRRERSGDRLSLDRLSI